MEQIAEREDSVYRDARRILSISERLRESFVNDFAVASECTKTVFAGPNFDVASIRPRRRRQPGAPPTVLFVGRQFVRKGGDLLLAAFARVRREIPSARLIIVGPRDLREVPGGVMFRGFINKDTPEGLRELEDLYEQADLFCMPSRFEGFAISFLEAMLFGLPCVSTWPRWTPPEMIRDGETGFAVEPEDTDALADRMLQLLRDPELAQRMGAAGRARVEKHFTWSAVAQSIDEALQQVVHEKSRHTCSRMSDCLERSIQSPPR
jgi:glycosyltransferase involved in cell wall biosynthesis